MLVVGSADTFEDIHAKVQGAAPIPSLLALAFLPILHTVLNSTMRAQVSLSCVLPFAVEKLPTVFYYTAVWCGSCKCHLHAMNWISVCDWRELLFCCLVLQVGRWHL